uniref:Acid phosphatase n=1 Tax=Plectus sambesii TaxID=2011161 RepID=A0A914WAK5_9BILA
MHTCIVALLLPILQLSQVGADELLFVQALWRHGDRSPTRTFPNDQYQVGQWPQGWGQLSAVGMQQHFSLGTRIRARYNNISPSFINATYRPSEIYVRSTDVNRTLMSALSNLAGFYQNGVMGVTFPDSNSVPTWPSHWSPIPVHTVDSNTDHIGNTDSYCPRIDQIYRAMEQSAIFKNITQQNQPLFDYLTNATGMHISLASGISSLHDTLFIEQTNNLTMPSWLNDSIWNQIVNLTQISDDFYFGIYPPANTEMIRLTGGSLLKSVVYQMQLKYNCTLNVMDMSPACQIQRARKYYVYSAHDTTLAGLLTTFNDEHQVLGMLLPKYAASILVELWNTTSGPQVQILYHPAFEMPYYPITNLTSGCPSTSDYCSLDTFVKRSVPYMPVDINAECQAQ